MKITDLKTYVVANPPPHHGGPYFIFLKLTTDDSIKGFGEVYGVPFSPHKVTQLIEDLVERYVIGWDPFNIELLWRTIYSSGYAQHPDLTTQGVLSGIEIACWDIVGKALSQPIYNLLGGQVREKLRSYTYLYAAPQTALPEGRRATSIHTDPVAAPERAAYYAEQGFTAVKFDPVGPMSSLDPRQLSLEVLENAELVTRNVREAAGFSGAHPQRPSSWCYPGFGLRSHEELGMKKYVRIAILAAIRDRQGPLIHKRRGVRTFHEGTFSKLMDNHL